MKISLNWLNDFVDLESYKEKPEALAQLLTNAGLEVEEIDNKSQIYKYVVIGLILKKSAHPDADKLSVCEVTTGEGVVHQIVCGAKNHKADDRVIVALPGAVLPGNFVIKNSTIRGVESAGMLCSLKELGMAEVSEGIAILPENATIGQEYAKYAGFDDIIFELKVTPNRADCLSHWGLAREIAGLLGQELKAPQFEFEVGSGSTKKEMSLEVIASDLCPRYAGRAIKNVRIAPSPDWLQKRLTALGLKSINNVVDVTNYIMHELGQPLHAFDVRFIEGRKIIVEKAKPGEAFITLDGTQIKLSGDELTIRDAEKAVALAGVVGGQNSGVQDDTTEIFLEAAYFAPQAVRKTARTHGVNTDSSYRFSRGVDPDGTLKALDRATRLILEVAGGEALGDYHDFYPHPVTPTEIKVTAALVSDRLGFKVETAALEKCLKQIGCEVKVSSEVLSVVPPLYRFDLDHEMDLVEEFARINGYQNIPESLPSLSVAPSVHDKTYVLLQKTSEILRGVGFSQALNYIFTNQDFQKRFLGRLDGLRASGLPVQPEMVRLMNPLNEEMSVLRSSLLPHLFKNVIHNCRHGQNHGHLFETGYVFTPKDKEYQEDLRLALIAWGESQSLWQKNSVPPVFTIKTAIETWLKQNHMGSWHWQSVKDKGLIPMFVHPGQFVQLSVEGKVVGFIGTLHPSWRDDYKLREEVAVGEFNFAQLLVDLPRAYRVQAPSVLPSVERDLALVMPATQAVAEIEKAMHEINGELLRSVEVFDVYAGEKLSKGQKSVAFRLIYQDFEKTLTEDQIQKMQEALINGLKERFALQVR